jgi:hypothetical protein
MCGLDYENILNPQQTPKDAKSMEDGDKDEEFVKAPRAGWLHRGYARQKMNHPKKICNTLRIARSWTWQTDELLTIIEE